MDGMFEFGMPWWQQLVRAVVVYLVLFALIRLPGRHMLAELGIFDLGVAVMARLDRYLAGDASHAQRTVVAGASGAVRVRSRIVRMRVETVQYSARQFQAWLQGRRDGGLAILEPNGRMTIRKCDSDQEGK